MRRKLADGFRLAEGPVWDDRRQTLFFVDIEDFKVHAFQQSGEINSYDTSNFVSALALTDDENVLLIARKDSLAYLDLADGAITELMRLDVAQKMRLNDGKTSPEGDFFVGSMGIGADRNADGCLYRVTRRGPTKVLEGLTIPNGMDWHDDFMYFIDTPSRLIVKYDTSFRPVDSYHVESGLPDGMTISANGTLYVALWGEGRVAAIDFERKREIGSFEICERNCSCPVLAHGRLFVASGAGESESGALYEFDIDDEKKEDNIWRI